MPEGGLPIDLSKVKEQYTFRITPQETGKQTLTAAVKQDKKELAKDEKDFVVSENAHPDLEGRRYHQRNSARQEWC